MATPPKYPPAPDGLADRGRKFWRRTVTTFDLEAHELELLAEACRSLDTLDALAEVVAIQGASTSGSMGQTVVNPAISEARQQRATLARLLGDLDLPAEEEAPAAPPSQVSQKASRAAAARWRTHNAGKGA